MFQSLNRPDVYVGPGGNLGQAFNSFFSKIWDENVTNFASLSVNSLAFFSNWSCCGRLQDLVNQHSWQTPHLCCHGGVDSDRRWSSVQSLTFLTESTGKRLVAANEWMNEWMNENGRPSAHYWSAHREKSRYFRWPVHLCNSSSLKWLCVCLSMCVCARTRVRAVRTSVHFCLGAQKKIFAPGPITMMLRFSLMGIQINDFKKSYNGSYTHDYNETLKQRELSSCWLYWQGEELQRAPEGSGPI